MKLLTLISLGLVIVSVSYWLTPKTKHNRNHQGGKSKGNDKEEEDEEVS